MEPAAVPLFRMEGVSKRYGGVKALEKADLTVEAGRIHAILGENGAGKSTLIKVMAGVVEADEGQMLLDGRDVKFASPAAANQAGIVCIFQELSLIPDLSVADNICISNPPKRFGLIDRRAQRRIAEEALARAGAEDIHPLAPVKDLALSRRQMVEIAKALGRNPRVLILDEATSALDAESESLVQAALGNLMTGRTVIVIAHRLSTVRRANRIVVLENGRITAIGSHEELLQMSPTYQKLYRLQFMDIGETALAEPVLAGKAEE
jgi:ribose transport system ATP-binding protein